MSNISDSGFWLFEAQGSNEHWFDSTVASKLIDLVKTIKPDMIYDFGCGEGKYTKNFIDNGFKAQGFDGNPSTKNIPNCTTQDLTDESFSLDPVDFLLTLEVAEHVPKHLEERLTQTIHRHVKPGGYLVLSWAVEGQPGLGHVNCRNNDYVIRKFEDLGYNYKKEESQTLRKDAKMFWFRNTIMVFKKLL
jgi:tryptophanyl-tRNA synthetase